MLEKIKCFLLDMDGTFYLGEKLLPGALEFIDLINKRNIDYLFLTNKSINEIEASSIELTIESTFAIK